MPRIDTRKGDRHKPTEARKKNRNRPGYKPPPKPPKAWEGSFTTIDGEGWNGEYTMLACSSLPFDAYDKTGLTTDICLRYLTSWGVKGKNAIVGFGLSYDFENILRDIPVEDYRKLLDSQTIVYHGYELKYIPRKILEIKKKIPVAVGKKDRFKAVYIQDTLGFFQSNFETALKKWDVEAPPIIAEGKTLRGDFKNQNPEWIKQYNREELRLLTEMMEKVRESDEQAFKAIGLEPNHGPRIWYGPGARAKNFLKQTAWVEEHPDFTGPAIDQLREDLLPFANSREDLTTEARLNLWDHPFAAAFFGGRIEAAALGEFSQTLYDYDINSAYPYALSLLPKWNENDLIRVDGLDPLNRMGMYHVEWSCPEGATFYPFPYRSQSKNVFFPPRGRGWYMSVEVYAALTVWGPGCIKVGQGYVLQGTEGGADGLTRLPSEKLCVTAKKIKEAADYRLEAKDRGESAEKTLKLVINSVYGKTIQQIGSHKFLNLFAASWITATCRGMIVRTIGRDLDHNVISVMTDGILCRNPFPVTLGKWLGEFELKTFDYALQFMPGVYYLSDSTGKNKTISKYRGMGKAFDPLEAKRILWEKCIVKKGGTEEPSSLGTWPVELNIFVTRKLADHQPNKFKGHEFTFYPVIKHEEFSLGSKRVPGRKGFRLLKKERHHFFDAKRADPGEVLLFGSKPYTLDLPVEGAYDDATNLDDVLDGSRIQSIVEASEYLL